MHQRKPGLAIVQDELAEAFLGVPAGNKHGSAKQLPSFPFRRSDTVRSKSLSPSLVVGM